MTDAKQHTPGPWAVHEDQWVGIEVRSANSDDLAEAPAYYVLASSIGGHRYGHEFEDDSEVRANANLIAAAPDLLEALEKALSRMEQDAEKIDGECGMAWPLERLEAEGSLPEEIMVARAAIAKAKGELPALMK